LFIDPRWKEDPQEDEINGKEWCCNPAIEKRNEYPLEKTSDLSRDGVVEISSGLRQLLANNEESVTPKGMLAELFSDNQQLTRSLRSTHEVCEKYNDVATASLIENWIDQTERRTWFLAENVRDL